MKATLEFNVKIPRVPNYLSVQGQNNAISVGDFHEETLREIGKQWTENLIHRARELRSQKKESK